MQAALDGVQEVWPAVLASTLTTVCGLPAGDLHRGGGGPALLGHRGGHLGLDPDVHAGRHHPGAGRRRALPAAPADARARAPAQPPGRCLLPGGDRRGALDLARGSASARGDRPGPRRGRGDHLVADPGRRVPAGGRGVEDLHPDVRATGLQHRHDAGRLSAGGRGLPSRGRPGSGAIRPRRDGGAGAQLHHRVRQSGPGLRGPRGHRSSPDRGPDGGSPPRRPRACPACAASRAAAPSSRATSAVPALSTSR